VFNLRWSGIAAAAAFIISLTLGISVRGQILIILLRALVFGTAFFLLAALIWRLINKYIPELLQAPSPQDTSLMEGLETGTRVNITLGDGEDSIPPDAALPPEEVDDSVGNITEVLSPRQGELSPRGSLAEADPSGASFSGAGLADASFSGEGAVEAFPGGTGPSPALSQESPAETPQFQSRGMDHTPQSGYTQRDASRAPSPPIQAPVGGVSGLGDLSGGVESLPDLDALAGTFLSPTAGVEDSASAGLGGSPPRQVKEALSKKGKDVGEDFNPKELASAIQTILKRD
jgi:hypothetical protein